MRKLLGWAFLLSGTWCMISAQALIGLKELRWLARYTFPAEALLGCLLFSAAFWAFNLERPSNQSS